VAGPGADPRKRKVKRKVQERAGDGVCCCTVNALGAGAGTSWDFVQEQRSAR